MSKIRKHTYLDKFEAYLPNKPHWVHEDYGVSGQSDSHFHTSVAYGYSGRRLRGFRFGINNKVFKASGKGIMIDSHYIGKSDNV